MISINHHLSQVLQQHYQASYRKGACFFYYEKGGDILKLVLCEKPSVGNTVAKVLGIKGRKDGYIECGDYIVSWCIGHLVGLALPDEYGAEYKKWDKLPIIPAEWKYNILPGTKKQFDIVASLLNRDDVDIFNMVATVLGKGNKERTVYLDQVAAMTLQAYLEARKDNSPALFAGKGTDRLQPGAIRQMLVKLGKNAKVTHVHPHKFRRTTATNLIRHGMPIQEVAAILGHDKLDTTMQYVVLDKTAVQYSYKKYA